LLLCKWPVYRLLLVLWWNHVLRRWPLLLLLLLLPQLW